MRRNQKSITTSPEIISNIHGLTEANFTMMTKLIHWLRDNESEQRKFRMSVIAKLCRLQAQVTSLYPPILAQDQQLKLIDAEMLESKAKALDEFISKSERETTLAMMKYISREERFPVAGFLGDGVSAGVGQIIADRFIFGPRRDESPAHGLQHSPIIFRNKNRNDGARGDVVTSLELTDFADELDEFFQFGNILSEGVATAHQCL